MASQFQGVKKWRNPEEFLTADGGDQAAAPGQEIVATNDGDGSPARML